MTKFADVEFDAPFTVADGEIVDTNVRNVYAPDVMHDAIHDIAIFSHEWDALTGFTGQYGYNGAVMHNSEQLEEGCGLADEILDNDGIYVLCAVMFYNDYNEMDFEGWVVLRYK